jgi:hypothetical protein
MQYYNDYGLISANTMTLTKNCHYTKDDIISSDNKSPLLAQLNKVIERIETIKFYE